MQKMALFPKNRELLRFAIIYTTTATSRAAQLACKCSLEAVQDSREDVHDQMALPRTPDLSGRIKFALTAIEYHMNFLRFSLSPSTGLRSLTIEAIKLAQSSTQQLETELSSLGPVSEESEALARRTETCFRDIICTLEEWRQLKESRIGTGQRRAGIQSPLFRSSDIFGSEMEKAIMIRLQHLHLRAATLSPEATVRELVDLCQELEPDNNVLSEAMRDTALRSLILILCTAKNQLQQRRTNEKLAENVYDLLESCFMALNRPADPQWEQKNCSNHKAYLQRRKGLVLNFLNRIKMALLTSPLTDTVNGTPLIEATPSDPPSALWQRLQSVESVATLTEGKEEEACAICLRKAFCQGDFALLSNCSHLYCIGCIAEWLNTTPTCPMCRTVSWSWTTKKYFEDFKKQSDTIEGNEPPIKRRRVE